jgi:acyl-CoA synthetase (AMP-forming)/AMP-acid ligase II
MGQLLNSSAAQYGDKDAVIFVGQNVCKSFEDLRQDADKLAGGFLSLGFKKGDRLGVWGNNSYEWYLTHKAGMKAGLIIV